MDDIRARPARRRLAVLAGVALAVVIVAEISARIVAPYLPEPLRWGDRATQVKALQLDAVAATGRCVDVVLAGNSMGRDAFDPGEFTTADPAHRSAYNASLDAASPAMLDRWLVDEVVPRLHPRLVLVPVASFDLNANSKAGAAALRAYDAAEQTRPDALGRVQAWAAGWSALVRNRAQLRDPSQVWTALAAIRAGEPEPRDDAGGIAGVVGHSGEGLSRRTLSFAPDPGIERLVRDQFLGDFAITDGSVAAMRTLVDRLHALGVTTVLVALPVTEAFVALHPNGAADFDRYLDSLRGLAASSGTPMLDLHDAAPVSRFADTHHLNGAGTTWFSTTLPDRLASLGLPPAPAC